jgi:hypothetical protein
MTDENNEKQTAITLAVLGEKLDHTNDKLDTLLLSVIKLNGTVRTDSDRITRLEERIGIWARTQAAVSAGFSIVTATIAAWWGSRP